MGMAAILFNGVEPFEQIGNSSCSSVITDNDQS